MKKNIRILCISGSLRSNSSTGSVVRALASLAPGYVDFIIYRGLASLPHFNDSDYEPPEVKDLREELVSSDGVFICTPEYAFGVPGSLKNALDWTVSSGEFVDKPVAVVTAATGGDKAHASLLLTFTALSATIADKGKVLIPFIRKKLNDKGEVADSATIASLAKAFESLILTIDQRAPSHDQYIK